MVTARQQYRDIYSYLETEFGVRVAPQRNPELSQATTTAQILFKRNANRFGFTVVNLSSNAMYVSPNSVASASNGIRLNPNGGSLSMNAKEDLDLPAQEWQILADTGTSNLFSLEWVLR